MTAPTRPISKAIHQVSPVNPASLEINRGNPEISRTINPVSLVNRANNPEPNSVCRANPANPVGRVVAASPEATNLAGKAVRRNKRWRH